MGDVVVGIDIGTTYTKAVATLRNGSIVALSRAASPTSNVSGPVSAQPWISTFRSVMRDVIANASGHRVVGLCISAITPTFVAFEPNAPERAYMLLYSWSPKGGTTYRQSDRELTDCRLRALHEVAQRARFNPPTVTDLVGYLNWRLTHQLTLNAVAAGEAGFSAAAGYPLALTRLVSPADEVGRARGLFAESCGFPRDVCVAGGCPDTLASVVGAGGETRGDSMLYLGTFGSLMCLEEDTMTLLTSRGISSPFRWMLSVPGLGMEIERRARRMFPDERGGSSLQQFDSAAGGAAPGADGMFFLLPRWRSGMRRLGQFRIVSESPHASSKSISRAVLEGIAVAVRIIGAPEWLRLSGGGASSRPWRECIATALQRDISVRDGAWEAAGAADVAAVSTWGEAAKRRTTMIHPASARSAVMERIVASAREIYAREGWI